jgi:hypothetical protein
MTYLKGLAAKLYLPTIDWSASRAFVKITGLQHNKRGTVLEISYWRTEKSYDDGAHPLHIEQLNVDAEAYAPLIASVYEVLYQGLVSANKYDTATIVQAEPAPIAPEPLPEATQAPSLITVSLDSPPIEILPNTAPSEPTPLNI